jgi:hypothetical protein
VRLREGHDKNFSHPALRAAFQPGLTLLRDATPRLADGRMQHPLNRGQWDGCLQIARRAI